MITNKELNEAVLSPTKKDYYQIWNELMELADKISERWSPASTNESDPGLVLLKVLTAVADKLNYNIDKNTLEAFMPSAAQTDSMRKLTEMMGYDMKHYLAATGKAVIAYNSNNELTLEKNFAQGIYFPKFINLKNEDEDINYITLEEFTLQAGQESREIAIMEGAIVECETNNDNIITTLHLDDLNRYILPEYAIAENGIFITNIADSVESSLWRREQNLNVQQPKTKVYKVGFDSAQNLPYVQFPEDIKTLMEDGLRIKYVRTNGLNGNIAAKTLSKFEKPALWATANDENIKNLAVENFKVTNNSTITNGADPETLNAAYNNYKKTIGTFDTLVTCRDYMNKIYQMTESETDTTPLVSNIIVSDIRDDINRSTPVCTFNEYGICYKDASLTDPITITLADGSSYPTTQNKIEHFDLILYPFKTVYGLNNKIEYKNSFKYSAENLEQIKAKLALTKNIAHNIVTPILGQDTDDIACIKNYLKLKAKIATTKKVTIIEESEILNNVYKAIYTNFNARQIDFGEEIPYDALVAAIKAADYRIKEVSLDEPTLNTKFCLVDGTEETLSDANHTKDSGNKLYNKLVRRNILAGKIAAFDYDTDFSSDFDKTSYPDYEAVYPIPSESAVEETHQISSLTSHFDVSTAFSSRDESKESEGLVLKENEVIQFRVPNFKTTKTYPAYVNYFIKLSSTAGSQDAIAATFKTLEEFMGSEDRWNSLIADQTIKNAVQEDTSITSKETFTTALKKHVAIFKKSGTTYNRILEYTDTVTQYYYIPINDNIFAAFNAWIKTQDSAEVIRGSSSEYKKLNGIYRTTGIQEKPYGRLIDESLYKYLPAYKFNNVIDNQSVLTQFYVQDTYAITNEDVIAEKVTADGLGRDAKYTGVPKDGEYQLKDGEYLLINYTDSKTDESGTEVKTVINKVYSAGDIIRANFELIDSALYHTNHSYSKKDGFTYSGQQPEGMFTLGVNEQIEIREQVQVELNDPSTYLYWTLNSDDPEAQENTFDFNEAYNGQANVAYTLKEGEHLYYTDSKKQDLVYYGAGTLVIKHSDTPELQKYASTGEVSEEDIMTKGLAANIPWQHFIFGDSSGLTIIEHQYLSLTEGDIIISINGGNPEADNSWQEVEDPLNTTYRLAEDATSSHLPVIAVNNLKWKVRSRLDFNMSKTTAQPLNSGDKIVVTFDDATTLDLISTPANGLMCINSNYACQATVDTIKTDALSLIGANLKLKISKQNIPTVAGAGSLLLNNYINGDAKYTKFNFASLPASYETGAAFSLNISIPANTFGLLAIYYIKDIDEIDGKGAKLTTNSNVNGIEFFNSADSLASTKYLHEGLNILKLTPDVKQLQIHPDDAKKSIIVFGNLDIVKGINPKLDYRIRANSGNHTSLDQLLSDLKNSGLTQDFYYNVPIQHSNEIDLNAAIEDDLLSSPLSWYDPNNVNRKFVISEIDADYLPTGITLTKSSRA